MNFILIYHTDDSYTVKAHHNEHSQKSKFTLINHQLN